MKLLLFCHQFLLRLQDIYQDILQLWYNHQHSIVQFLGCHNLLLLLVCHHFFSKSQELSEDILQP